MAAAAAAPPPVLETRKRGGIMGLLRRGDKDKDLKKFVKESGVADRSGLLWKYKDKSSEWRQRWVEVRGSYLMWTSSKSREPGTLKDFIDLAGAKLIDDASVLGVDASGKQRSKGNAVVYTIDSKGMKKQGNMRDSAAVSREFSWRVTGPSLTAAVVFAAEGDHEKEEWWRAIQRGINLASERLGEEVYKVGEIPLFAQGDVPMSISKSQVDFDFLHVVGRGAYGRVIKVRERSTGEIYVCKVLEKRAVMKHRMLHEVKKESSLLQTVEHPFIVSLYQAYQTRDKLFLLMEFLSGGELFFHMMNEPTKRFTEDRARFYAAQLVLAVGYLHHHTIIHCDLKAENCVLTRDGYVKLTDFGFATAVHADEKVFKRNGTPVYMAPEMIQRREGYSYPVDVWALGVLIYAMLTGYFPFHGDTARQTLEFVCTRLLAYPPGIAVTDSARSLLGHCLDRDPDARITCAQMRSDPFFRTIDFVRLERREVRPPFQPDHSSGSNTRYFPTTYETETKSQDPKVSMHSVHASDEIFKGFAFVRSESTRSQMMPRYLTASGELSDSVGDSSPAEEDMCEDHSADTDFVTKLNEEKKTRARAAASAAAPASPSAGGRE
eukprot:TRINITY_DN4579_c1_g1_i1.p1 TRINITY_DN4579_c1_g1~~TRINITY_DN4579_c1_g1_i1.p1  ORF type:complete len:634 (+),score=153.95 TRINITY_DN4579_c1_g1_i1:86-1903(+)